MLDRLDAAGLRATRTRRVLAALLFNGHNRHVTVEQLQGEAIAARFVGDRSDGKRWRATKADRRARC